MRSDAALLTLVDGGLPVQNPSTAAEDARLASLISLDGILKQVKVLFLMKLLFICITKPFRPFNTIILNRIY